MRTSCDTTDVKPEIRLVPKFVKSVFINYCCDGIGNTLLGLRYGIGVYTLYL